MGDFETLKHLFSLPEMQGRLGHKGSSLLGMTMEERMVENMKGCPGVSQERE